MSPVLRILRSYVCRQNRAFSSGAAAHIGTSMADRELLQAAAPAASLTPAQTDLSELTATEAVAMLCSRNVTAVDYVGALFARLDAGWSCINSFQTLNRSMVSFCAFHQLVLLIH